MKNEKNSFGRSADEINLNTPAIKLPHNKTVSPQTTTRSKNS